MSACEGLEPRQLLLPLNLINRLVLTPQQAFSAQYIQVCRCVSPHLLLFALGVYAW
jgi:hypothetical protein